MPHAILYPLFDFHFQKQLPNFFDTETELRNLVMAKALEVMEEVLDEFEVQGKVWHIEKLELDLGEIDLHNLYRDFPYKLKQTLRKNLAKIRFDAQLLPEIYQETTPNTQEFNKQVAWEALQIYISEGEKRWWMTPEDQNLSISIGNSQKTLFVRLFDYVADQDEQGLKVFLQKIKNNETAKNRILGQISMQIFAKVALGQKNTFLYQHFSTLTQDLTQIAGLFAPKKVFEKYLLSEFWAFALAQHVTFTKEKLHQFLFSIWQAFSKKTVYFPAILSLQNRLERHKNPPKIHKNTEDFIVQSALKNTPNEKKWRKSNEKNENFEKNQILSQFIETSLKTQTENTFKEKDLMQLVAEVYPAFAPDLVLFLRELFAKTAWFNTNLYALKRHTWRVISDYFWENRYGMPDMFEIILKILKSIQAKFRTEEQNFAGFWQRSNIIGQYNTQKLEWHEVLTQKELKTKLFKMANSTEIMENTIFWAENIINVEKLLTVYDHNLAKSFVRLLLGVGLYKTLEKLVKKLFDFIKKDTFLNEKTFEIQFFQAFLDDIFNQKEILQKIYKETQEKNNKSIEISDLNDFFVQKEHNFFYTFWIKIPLKPSFFEKENEEIYILTQEWQKIQRKFAVFKLPDIFPKKITKNTQNIVNIQSNTAFFDKITQKWQATKSILQAKNTFSTQKEKENLFFLLLDNKKQLFDAWITQISKITAQNFKGISNNITVWKGILYENLLEYLYLHKNKEKPYQIPDFAQYLAEKWIKTYQVTSEYLQEVFVSFPDWQVASKQIRQNIAYSIQSLRYFLETGSILWTEIWEKPTQNKFSDMELLWVALLNTQTQIFRAIITEFGLAYHPSVPMQVYKNIKNEQLKMRMLSFLGYDVAELGKTKTLSKKQLRKEVVKAKNEQALAEFKSISLQNNNNSNDNTEEHALQEDENTIFPLKKSILQQLVKNFQQDFEVYFEKEKNLFTQTLDNDISQTQKIRTNWQQKLAWITQFISVLGQNDEKNIKTHWETLENVFPNIFKAQDKINPLWFSLDIAKDFLVVLGKNLKLIMENQLSWLQNLSDLQTKIVHFDASLFFPTTSNQNIYKKIKRHIQIIYQNYANKNISFDFFKQKNQEITQNIVQNFQEIGIEKEFLLQFSKEFLEELTILEETKISLTKSLNQTQIITFLADFSQKIQGFYKNYLSVLEGIYLETKKTAIFFKTNPEIAKLYTKNKLSTLIKNIFERYKTSFSPKKEIQKLLEKYTNNTPIFSGITLQNAQSQAHIWVENLFYFEKYNDFSQKIINEKGILLDLKEFLQEFYKNFPEILVFQWQNIGKSLKNTIKNLLPTLYKILLEETANFYTEFQNITQQINEKTYQGRGNKVESPKENTKKILEKIAEITQKAEKKQEQRKDEPLYVHNAGLVILHPYLVRLFGMLEWFQKGKFVSPETQTKAVLALEFMASKKYENLEEGNLLLNKIMVGMSFKDALIPDVALTEKELDTCESLLKGVLQNWKSMADSTIDNFRTSFLLREGRLIDSFGNWTLRVEQKTWDMLMGSLPWSVVIVKMSCMRVMLNVEW